METAIVKRNKIGVENMTGPQNSAFVSVIIPNYNGEKIIGDCLSSVYSSGYPNFEVVLVDDDSNDNSVWTVEKFFPQTQIIKNKKNLGFAATVNKGIKFSKGQIVVLLNMDTIVKKNWLTELVKALLLNDKIGIVGSKMLEPNGMTIQHAGGLIDAIGISKHIGRGEIDNGQYDLIKEVDYVCGASMAFKKDLIKKTGFLDEGYSPLYYEDTDFAYQAKKRGYKIIYVPTSVLLHRENYSLGKFSSHFFFYYNKSRLRFMIKNFALQYLFFVFLKNEKKWFKNIYLKSEKQILLKAYIGNIPYLMKMLLIKMFDRRGAQL